MLKGIIGPLQLAIHVLQNRSDREQEKHWERTNKGNYCFKRCEFSVCFVPVGTLLSNMVVLYHVNH